MNVCTVCNHNFGWFVFSLWLFPVSCDAITVLFHTALFSCLNTSVGYMLQSGIASSKTMCFFNLNKHCQMTFLKKGNDLFAHLYLGCGWKCFYIFFGRLYFFCFFCLFSLGMFVFLLIDFPWKLRNLTLGLCYILEIVFPNRSFVVWFSFMAFFTV